MVELTYNAINNVELSEMREGNSTTAYMIKLRVDEGHIAPLFGFRSEKQRRVCEIFVEYFRRDNNDMSSVFKSILGDDAVAYESQIEAKRALKRFIMANGSGWSFSKTGIESEQDSEIQFRRIIWALPIWQFVSLAGNQNFDPDEEIAGCAVSSEANTFMLISTDNRKRGDWSVWGIGVSA